MKKILFTFVLLSLVVSSFAQDTMLFNEKYIRISAGYKGDYLFTDGDNPKVNTDMFMSGGSLGLEFGYNLSGNKFQRSAVYLEAGPEVGFTFGKNNDKSNGKLKLTTLSVPVNLRYKLMMDSKENIFVAFLGATPKYNAMAKMDYQTTEKKVDGVYVVGGHAVGNSYKTEVINHTIDLFSKDDMGEGCTASRVQLGVHAGIGIEIEKQTVGIYYRFNYDVVPFLSYTNKKEDIRTNIMTHSLTISYIIPYKK